MTCVRRVAAYILSGLVLCSGARAQSGSITMSVYDSDRYFAPQFSRRDLRMFEQVLGLSSDEKIALDALYEAYTASLRTRCDEIRAVVTDTAERAEVLGNRELLNTLGPKRLEWDKQARALQEQFLDDLKSLLSGDQAARWPIVERELRRVKKMPTGRLMGESVDVVQVTLDVLGDEKPSAAVGELLEQYAQDADRAILAREAVLERHADGFRSLIDEDPVKAEGVWNEAQHVRRALRELNRRYAERVALLLTSERAEALSRRIFELNYPKVMTPTRAFLFIERAAGLKDLSNAERAAAEDIRERYERRVWEWRRKAAAEEVKHEDDELPRELAGRVGRLRPGEDSNSWDGRLYLPEDHPLVKVRQERYELDRAARLEMESALSMEHRREAQRDLPDFAKFDNWAPWGL